MQGLHQGGTKLGREDLLWVGDVIDVFTVATTVTTEEDWGGNGKKSAGVGTLWKGGGQRQEGRHCFSDIHIQELVLAAEHHLAMAGKHHAGSKRITELQIKVFTTFHHVLFSCYFFFFLLSATLHIYSINSSTKKNGIYHKNNLQYKKKAQTESFMCWKWNRSSGMSFIKTFCEKLDSSVTMATSFPVTSVRSAHCCGLCQVWPFNWFHSTLETSIYIGWPITNSTTDFCLSF